MYFKIFLLFFCFSAAFSLFAQKPNVESTRAYYDSVYIAQEKILNLNFQGALNTYVTLQKAHKDIFTKDLDNAFYAAIKAKNWKKACFFAELQFNKGVDTALLFRNKNLNEFKRTCYWNKLIRYYALQSQQPNKTLKSKIDSLLIADQRYREPLPNQKNLERWKQAGDVEKWKAEDTLIRKEIIGIFQTEDFPKEERIGFWSDKNEDYIQESWLVLLIHQVKTQDKYILAKMLRALHERRLDIWKFCYVVNSAPYIYPNTFFNCSDDPNHTGGLIAKIEEQCYTCPSVYPQLDKNRSIYYLPLSERVVTWWKLKSKHFQELKGFFFPELGLSYVTAGFISEEQKQKYIKDAVLTLIECPKR